MTIDIPIAFIDIESTGVDPVLDRIIELGVAILMPDMTRKWGCFRVNPGIPIPPESTAIHGITDADVAHCPPFSALAAKVSLVLAGKDIGVYNGWRLDLPILDEELRRCDLKLDLAGVRVIDCFGIFTKKEPRKLADAVRRYCGREHAGAHGAKADAEASLDVLLGQLTAHPDLGAMSLDKLAEFSRIGDLRYADVAGKLYYDADGEVCYAFGKYKGSKVLDNPDYADWILSRRFPASTCEVLRAVLKTLETATGGVEDSDYFYEGRRQ